MLLERPKGTVPVVRRDDSPLGHERDNGKEQPAIASSREDTPPDVDDGTEKRRCDRPVASPKGPRRRRQPPTHDGRQDGKRGVLGRGSLGPPPGT
jgi:hypothetical protein